MEELVSAGLAEPDINLAQDGAPVLYQRDRRDGEAAGAVETAVKLAARAERVNVKGSEITWRWQVACPKCGFGTRRNKPSMAEQGCCPPLADSGIRNPEGNHTDDFL